MIMAELQAADKGSYLVARSPGCETCHQNCEICPYWTGHWSPIHPESNKKNTINIPHMYSLDSQKQNLQ